MLFDAHVRLSRRPAPGSQCVFWPSDPENVYRATLCAAWAKFGDRISCSQGQGQQPSYGYAKCENIRATDKVAAALATISKPLAEHMANLLLLGGKDLTIALPEAAILETGPVKVSTFKREVMFQCHCVVIEGELPGNISADGFPNRQIQFGKSAPVEILPPEARNNAGALPRGARSGTKIQTAAAEVRFQSRRTSKSASGLLRDTAGGTARPKLR